VVHRRDTDLRDLRRHYGSIIRNQSEEIKVFGKRNEILMSIALGLVLMVLLTWFSASDECDSGLDSNK